MDALATALTGLDALLGSAAFVLLGIAGAPVLAAGLAGMAIAFAVRAGAILRGWSLPGFRGPA
jgi:uncharacterized membrane protein YeiH